MVETGSRLIHKDGVRYFISGDLNNPELRTLMLRARNHLEEAKRHNTFDLDEIYIEKANEYTAESRFGIDTIEILLPEFEEKEKRLFEKERIEARKETREEYVIAHEVWILDYPTAAGYPNVTQVGYLLCLGGGWNPPYEFIEPVASIQGDDIIRNVVHPWTSRAEWDAEVEKGVTVYPFFWNYWKFICKNNWGEPFADWPNARPWDGLNLPNNELQEILVHTEYTDVVVEYWDVPCQLEEHINAEELLWRWDDAPGPDDHNWNTHSSGDPTVYWFDWDCSYKYAPMNVGRMALYMSTPGSDWDETERHIVVPGTDFTFSEGWTKGYGNHNSSVDPGYYWHAIQYDPDNYWGTVQYEDEGYGTYYLGPNEWWSGSWASAKDLSQYAFYYEWEYEYQATYWDREVGTSSQEFWHYDFEQGINVNGKKYVIQQGFNEPYSVQIRSNNPTHIELQTEGVCLKYFDEPEWVIATIQQLKGVFDRQYALPGEVWPGPQTWFVWIDVQAEELHFDRNDPYHNFGPLRYGLDYLSLAEDDWMGSILGDWTDLYHFRRIPDAPPYIDKDGGEHELITAGQFRLFRLFAEKEHDPVIIKEQIEI